MRISIAVMLLCIGSRIASAQAKPQQLDTAHVTVASRTSTWVVALTRSVEVITRDDIQRLGARTVQDVLARAIATDVLARSPASADLAIRGTSLGQVLVLVDGVRMTDRQTPHFDLDVALPLDQIERIEIVRGPASAQYGADAVGGVVNIVTARGDMPSTSAHAHAGSFGTVAASLSQPWISAEHQRSDGHRAGTDYRATQLYAALGSAKLGGNIGQSVRDFGANSFYGPYDSHERTATTTGEIHAERALGASLRGSASLSMRRHADQFTLRRSDPAFYRNRHVSLQSAFTAVVRHADNFAIGGELADAFLTSARLGDRRDFTGAAFAQATFALNRTLADLGIRADWTNGFGTVVSPSLAASQRLTEDVTIRASASRAFRAPSWTERYYTDPANTGNPNLTAEHFTVGEIGARGGPIDIALWARRGTDVIDWVKPSASPAGPWETQNISTIDFRGADAEVALPAFGGAHLTTYASLLRFDAAITSGYTGKYALRPLTSVFGVRADIARWERVSVTLDARHARRAYENRAQLNANGHVAVRVREATLAVHLENLANANYLDVTGKPVAGRGIILSAKWR